MRSALTFILGVLLFCSVSMSLANTTVPTQWFSQDQNKQIKLRVDLFLSSVCPHCHKADEFFRALEGKETWLDVHHYLINQDKAALGVFHQQLQQQQADSFVVPAIFFCDSHWVGFAQADNSGKELLRALNYCYQQIVATGQLNAVTRHVLKQWATANWYNSSIDYRPSAAGFIPMIALTDALNPCAMFCILALFAFLWLAPTPSIQVRFGLLSLIAIGCMHAIQQMYTAGFYNVLAWLSIPVALLGLGLLVYVGRNYYKASQSRSDPQPNITGQEPFIHPSSTFSSYSGRRENEGNYLEGSSKKPSFNLVLGVLTVLVIQAYQQTCTPNFSLVFEQWITVQQLSPIKHAFYECSYQLVYLLFLFLLMIMFSFFSRSKRLDRHRLVIRQVSWLILAIIGGFFIVDPQGLSSLLFSFIALIFALFVGWLIAKRSSIEEK